MSDEVVAGISMPTMSASCPRCGYVKASWRVACKGCLVERLHDVDCRFRVSVMRAVAVPSDECSCKDPVALMRRPRRLLWYGPIGKATVAPSPLVAALPPPVELTLSEVRLLESVDADGHAWIVPAQLAMAKRMRDRGLITIDGDVRPHRLCGASERRVTVCAGREKVDATPGG